MSEKKYAIVLRRRIKGETPGIGIGDMAVLCGVHPGFIGRLVNLGLVDPLEPIEKREEQRFDEATVSTVQKIMRLRNQLGINYAGIGVVLDLLSRIESLESRLRELEPGE